MIKEWQNTCPVPAYNQTKSNQTKNSSIFRLFEVLFSIFVTKFLYLLGS